MAKNSISKISNAFATGGGGVNFEQKMGVFLMKTKPASAGLVI